MLIPKWISNLIGICAWGGVHISSAKRRTTKSFKAHLSGVCQKWHNHWVMSSPVPGPEVATLYKMQWSLICHHITDYKRKSQLTCDREGPILLATSMDSCFYLGLLFCFVFGPLPYGIEENASFSVFVWGFLTFALFPFCFSFIQYKWGRGGW